MSLTAIVMFSASGAMYVTSSPKWVSLLVEPLSLLLLPGLVCAIAVAGAHDFAPDVVIAASTAFYLGFFYAGLLWRAARRGRRQTR